MSKIIVQDEEQLKYLFVKAVQLLMQMRKAQKQWHKEFGADSRQKRERWEAEADAFIQSLEIINPEHTVKPVLKIENKNTDL